MKLFTDRHIGPTRADVAGMLDLIGVDSVDELIEQTVPGHIRLDRPLNIEAGMTEYEYLKALKYVADRNICQKSYIGQGYYGTITPAPILRNIFQNPGWYTQYTPYQAEIAQGRLEALLNFQTVVADLTALPIANASLLDEGTAAAEAMAMFHALRNKRNAGGGAHVLFVDHHVFPQTIEVVKTRANPLGITVVVDDWKQYAGSEGVFAVLLQYPNAQGLIEDYRQVAQAAHDAGAYVIAAADILALTLLTPPGEWGADAVVGSTQRLGIPMGYGGPHAAYFSTREKFKRQIPGRIIGVSVDANGDQAFRMALQTREQHIRREKATSNICTAQALLAIMAGMYAVYHGPEGLKQIATEIGMKAHRLSLALRSAGYDTKHDHFFDTIAIRTDAPTADRLVREAEERRANLFRTEEGLQITVDETTSEKDLQILFEVLGLQPSQTDALSIPPALKRESTYLSHPVFHDHQTETRLMRYIKSLENKDLSLTHAMIPLGSCTMKLNAATQLIPVSWKNFAHIHPFAPANQTRGYQEILTALAKDLCEITGFEACSFQPNSGAQGEFAGLMAIRSYHLAQGDTHRDITLIPSSAHGTNPASAVMAGMKVVIVACDDQGNIDVDDLRQKATEHQDSLAALMITYPSTHGVFEEAIVDICDIIHDRGGLVYMDGANMNAQVGLTNPARIGADVCHLNLHKTFAIPHGGGGPGMGPICVNARLTPHLAGHLYAKDGDSNPSGAVSSAPFGSASILLISYGYIKMLGAEGLRRSTEIAIVNANYIRARLSPYYPVLYLGTHGHCAHELILDLRHFKSSGIGAEDVAKRLIDYGFHAPTLSFPVAGTLMVEPTESEDKEELDRFCDAMIQIKQEIEEVSRGEYSATSNVLVHAPHTIECLTSDTWTYPYPREKAAYPLPWLRRGHKFWSPVRRVDNAYGDRTLVCTCPPIEAYLEEDR